MDGGNAQGSTNDVKQAAAPVQDDGFDILGMGTGNNTNTATNQEEDLFGDDNAFGAPAVAFINMPEESLVKKDTKGRGGNTGISIKGGFKKLDRMSNNLVLALKIKNKSSVALSDFVIQLKPNQFGMKIIKPDNFSIRKFF